MHLTEAEDTTKRWQEYTEELCKKDIHNADNHDVVITHLEPDILECEVKWALGSITMNKASGGDGIPVESFQILKGDAGKVLHSICQQIRKTRQWPKDWKRSVFISTPKKAIPNNVQTAVQLHSFHMLASSCSKSSKLGFNSMWTKNFQMYELDLKNVEEPEIKLPTSVGSRKCKRILEKHLLLLHWLC